MNHLSLFIPKFSNVFRQRFLTFLAAFIFFCSVQISHSAIEGAVAKWLFDEGNGNVAEEPINGLDGTLNGNLKWVKGRFGKALEFSKTNSTLLK